MSLHRLIWLLPNLVIGGGALINYHYCTLTSCELSELRGIGYPTVLSTQALIFDLPQRCCTTFSVRLPLPPA